MNDRVRTRTSNGSVTANFANTTRHTAGGTTADTFETKARNQLTPGRPFSPAVLGVTSVPVTRNIVTVDRLTPGYFDKVKSGEILPTNPYSKTESFILDEPAYSVGCSASREATRYGTQNGKDLFNWRFDLVSVQAANPPSPPSLFSSSERNQLSVEAIAKLRTQGMDALTSASELHQTIAMLASCRGKLVKMITDGVKYLKRKGYKDIPRSLKSFLDFLQANWLEGRFGWRILYFDLMAIFDYIKGLSKDPKLIVGRSSKKKDSSTTKAGVTTITTHEVSVGYPGIIDYSILGHGSIQNTAWDILPWSLVIDMFFDVQTWIQAHSGPARNVKELPASAFIKEVKTVRTETVAKLPVGEVEIIFQVPQPVILERKVTSRIHTSQPALGLPAFKLNLGGFKPIDLMFLTRILWGKLS